MHPLTSLLARRIPVGDIVEARARIVHTGRSSMHISVHVRSGDPKEQERRLTMHSLLVFVALGPDGRPVPVPDWTPVSDEDKALDQHARHLIELRSTVGSGGPTTRTGE